MFFSQTDHLCLSRLRFLLDFYLFYSISILFYLSFGLIKRKIEERWDVCSSRLEVKWTCSCHPRSQVFSFPQLDLLHSAELDDWGASQTGWTLSRSWPVRPAVGAQPPHWAVWAQLLYYSVSQEATEATAPQPLAVVFFPGAAQTEEAEKQWSHNYFSFPALY